MGLPSVIKVKGYRLVRNDSYDEPLYSVVLEARAKSLSSAITRCISKAKSIEEMIQDSYGLIYYGFEVLTQVKDENCWHAVVRADYIPDESINDESEEYDYKELYDGRDDLSVKKTKIDVRGQADIVESMILLNIIDELEMILMRPPLIRDVTQVARDLGIRNAASKLINLSKKGLVSIKKGRVSRENL